jgi:hypothetical protein
MHGLFVGLDIELGLPKKERRQSGQTSIPRPPFRNFAIHDSIIEPNLHVRCWLRQLINSEFVPRSSTAPVRAFLCNTIVPEIILPPPT